MTNSCGRVRYIDYVKGIGISIIVLYHVTGSIPALSRITGYLSGFNVVLFFIAGGCLNYYFRDSSPVGPFVEKKARTLLIPYIVFSVFNSSIKLIVLLIRKNLTAEVFKAEMMELLITGNGTVWFLPIYFAVTLVFFAMLRKKSRIAFFLIFTVSLTLPYIITAFFNGPFFVLLNRLLSGLANYIFGFSLAAALERIELKSGWCFAIGLLCFIIGTLCYRFFGVPYSLFFWKGHFSHLASSVSSAILISTGIILLTVSFDFLIKRDLGILLWFGKNSLLVMLIHPTILLCFTQTCNGYFEAVKGVKSALIAAGLFLIIMAIDVPLVILIKNRFPWVLGKRKAC